jgi:hypothetical protein
VASTVELELFTNSAASCAWLPPHGNVPDSTPFESRVNSRWDNDRKREKGVLQLVGRDTQTGALVRYDAQLTKPGPETSTAARVGSSPSSSAILCRNMAASRLR